MFAQFCNGRYQADLPGQDIRKRTPVKVGLKEQMAKPEARRKLRAILDELGVNTEARLV
jgi:predicted rRNA methylase YqxC with S4 and FtsJ domains